MKLKKQIMLFTVIFLLALASAMLFFIPQVHASYETISLIQGPYYASNVGSLSSITVSLGSAPSQGDTVVLSFGNYGGGSQITGVTESGVSWNQAINVYEYGQPATVWYGYVTSTSASATIMVTLNGDESNGGYAIAYEFSGISNVSPVVDQTASSYSEYGTGPTATTGTTGTTSVAPELAFGTISQDQPLENSASNGFTLVTYGIGGGEYTSALYKVLTSTGTAGSTVTTSNSDYSAYTGVIVTFKAQQTESITITSSSTGSGFVTVNGNAISTPDTFTWNVGATYTIAANSPVSGGAGTQYIFSGWSDSGAQSHSYTVPSSPATVTASFTTQYYITVSSVYGSPTEASQWVTAGNSFSVSVTSPYATGAGTHEICTPTTQSISSVESAATLTFSWQLQYYLTVTSNYGSPSGQNWYNASAPATFAVTSPVTIVSDESQYAFNAWNGSGTGSYSGSTVSNSVTMNSPIAETASWNTQFYLSVSSTYGSPTGQGWYNSGASASLTVTTPTAGTSGIQYVTSGWTGTGSLVSGGIQGSSSTGSFTIGTYSTVTWNWITQYYLTVTSSYGSPTGQGWYSLGGSAPFSVTSPVSILSGQTQELFTTWAGTGSGSYNSTLTSTSVTMGNPITETAGWQLQYSITPSSDSYSTISPNVLTWVDAGSNQSFTFSANEGYIIQKVLIDGSIEASTTSPYTFTDVEAAATISASTSTVTYYVTATSDSGSIIYPSGLIEVSADTPETLTCSALSGYTLNNFYINGTEAGLGVLTSNKYTFTPTGNTTLYLTSTSTSSQGGTYIGTGTTPAPSSTQPQIVVNEAVNTVLIIIIVIVVTVILGGAYTLVRKRLR